MIFGAVYLNRPEPSAIPSLSRSSSVFPELLRPKVPREDARLPLPSSLSLPLFLQAGTDSIALHGPSVVFLFSLRPPKIFEPKSLFFFSSTHSTLKGLVNRDSTERGRCFSSSALINSSSLGRWVCRPQFSLVCAESGHRGRLPVQTVCVGAGGRRGGERVRKKGSREGQRERLRGGRVHPAPPGAGCQPPQGPDTSEMRILEFPWP